MKRSCHELCSSEIVSEIVKMSEKSNTHKRPLKIPPEAFTISAEAAGAKVVSTAEGALELDCIVLILISS